MKISQKASRIVGVGAALLAVVAVSAIALVSSASAAIVYLLAEWLDNGAALTSSMLAEVATEALLENTKVSAVGGAAVSVTCKGMMIGDIGANGAVDITEVLNLSGTAISRTPLSEPSLLCAKEALCESSRLWAVNLPWLGELELWEEGSASGFVVFLAATKGKLGWYLECTILGVKAEDECHGTEEVDEATKNLAEGVEVLWSEAVNALFGGGKLATCTQSGDAETGVAEGISIIRLPTGGPLSASE